MPADLFNTINALSALTKPVDSAKKKSDAKSEKRAAVNAALVALSRTTLENANGPGAKASASVPTARTRSAIEELAQSATIEEFEASQPNMKQICKDLFDWKDTKAQTRATGSVVKAAARALAARNAQGVSLYPVAVEMLAFAAAAAPLLQPDRLVRLLDSTHDGVSTAYAPDRYTMKLYNNLYKVIDRYPEQRREQLLIDLWKISHTGRFWDYTSGVTQVKIKDEPRAPGNEAARDAAWIEIRNEILSGSAMGSADASVKIQQALFENRLPYNPRTAEMLAVCKPNIAMRDKLVEFANKVRAGEPVHPDTVVMVSHIPWAKPDERAESPICWMVRVLVAAITPDPETGIARMEALPEKPKTFKDLYPAAELTGFPHPNGVRRFDGAEMPGVQGVRMEVVKNAAELVDNQKYMGNCTGSYRGQMEKGTYVLFKLWAGNDCYNLAYVVRNNGNAWAMQEINSRFNRGNVPAHIRTAAEQLAAHLPAHVAANGERNTVTVLTESAFCVV